MSDGVLVVTSSYPRGPDDHAGHFVRAEVESLRARGTTVRVLAAGRPARAPSRRCVRPTEGEGAPPTWLGGRALFDHPGALPRLRENPLRAVALAEPSWRLDALLRDAHESRVVVHWLVPFAPLVLARARQFRAIELVAHGSDVALLGRLPPRLVRLLFDYRQSPRATDVTFRFVSERLRRELSELVGAETDLGRAMAHGRVEPSPVELPPLPERALLRVRHGISERRFLVVIVGRLVSEKRVDLAIEAATARPDTCVRVIGDGPLRRELTKRFPNAEFLGARPRREVLEHIRMADVLVSASSREGAPTVVREARALGVPVVTSDVGDVASLDDPGLFVVRAGRTTPRSEPRQ